MVDAIRIKSFIVVYLMSTLIAFKTIARSHSGTGFIVPGLILLLRRFGSTGPYAWFTCVNMCTVEQKADLSAKKVAIVPFVLCNINR